MTGVTILFGFEVRNNSSKAGKIEITF